MLIQLSPICLSSSYRKMSLSNIMHYLLMFCSPFSSVNDLQLRIAQLSPLQFRNMIQKYIRWQKQSYYHFTFFIEYKLQNKIVQAMNELVIDKRIFLQTKKRSNTKTILPEIKYPLNFNMNGSSILRRINQQIIAPKENAFKQKSYQVPLSNILISKRITPINPEDSPNQRKGKQNYSYVPKQESTKKLAAEPDPNAEEGNRKTSTSLSQRPHHRRMHQRFIVNQPSQEIKSVKVSKSDQLTVVIGKANNNEDLVRQILAERKIWKQIKWGEGIPHLKWVFSKQRHNYKKMLSFTQTRAINHFQFNEELTTKDNMIRNLQLYCQTKKMQIFTLTPITFIVDFDDQYCQYNIKQFLGFFTKNDPRKNLVSSRKTGINTYNFVTKFQPYMAWQNSDIKKKVNILSRPVNSSTYYSQDAQPGYVWLLKPTGLNRGRGIEIFDSLQSLEKMLMDFLAIMNRKNFKELREKEKKKPKIESNKNQVKSPTKIQNKFQSKPSTGEQKQPQQQQKLGQQTTEDPNEHKFCRQGFKLSTCSFVIQKYVQRPFLIHKRKFDIRVWVLLTQSLCLHFFKEGYIRTSAQEFQMKDIDNYFIHLTNNAIQKNSSSYGLFQNGNQLSFKDLSKFVGEQQTERIWERMKQITHMAFSSVNKKINQNHRKFCFQLFGLDFIIDQELKAWLIQINQNPCIECASPLLSKLIPRMINDAFKLTIDQIFTDRRPTQKTYPVPGYSNSENMWQLLGQLGPNAQYSPPKDASASLGLSAKQNQKQGIKQQLKQSLKLRKLQQVHEVNEPESKEMTPHHQPAVSGIQIQINEQ